MRFRCIFSICDIHFDIDYIIDNAKIVFFLENQEHLGEKNIIFIKNDE